MDSAQDKPAVIISESNADTSAELFRHAAQAAKTSRLLIIQTEQLLEKSRQLFGTPAKTLIPK